MIFNIFLIEWKTQKMKSMKNPKKNIMFCPHGRAYIFYEYLLIYVLLIQKLTW